MPQHPGKQQPAGQQAGAVAAASPPEPTPPEQPGISMDAGEPQEPVLDESEPAFEPRQIAEQLFSQLLSHVGSGGQVPGLTSEGAGSGFDVSDLMTKYTPQVGEAFDDETGHIPHGRYSPPDGESRFGPFNDAALGAVVPGQDGIPHGLQPNAARGAAAARRILGFTGSIGGLGERGTKSDHPHGNAIDIMTGDNIDAGWEMAHWFHANREALGITYIIFNGKIASPRGGWAWRAYRHPAGRTDATAMHHDHIHISFKGGQPAAGSLSPAPQQQQQAQQQKPAEPQRQSAPLSPAALERQVAGGA